MGVSGIFYQIRSDIAEAIANKLASKKVLDEELINLIETNTISSLYLGKWYDEIAVILSKKNWSEYDTKDIGYQIIHGGETLSFEDDDDHLGFITKDKISRNLKWLKSNSLDSFTGFSEYYSNLSEEIIDFLRGISDSTVSDHYKDLQNLIEFYTRCHEGEHWILVWIG
jgi:hypothetical protein